MVLPGVWAPHPFCTQATATGKFRHWSLPCDSSRVPPKTRQSILKGLKRLILKEIWDPVHRIVTQLDQLDRRIAKQGALLHRLLWCRFVLAVLAVLMWSCL